MTLKSSSSQSAAQGGQGGNAQEQPLGSRAAAAPQVDLEKVTQRVYELMLEDLRLELARREGRAR